MRGIYAIVDAAASRDPVAALAPILDAGIVVVQYRAKSGVDRATVRAMVARTRAARALLIVNDDFDAALDADGWHAGQEDLAARDPVTCRRLLGDRLFGISCGTPEEARVAEALGADYLGTGPFRATASKADAGDAIGVAGVAAVVAATRLPVAAIGGIDRDALADVARSGARMAAVISAISLASDPGAAARALVARWNEVAP